MSSAFQFVDTSSATMLGDRILSLGETADDFARLSQIPTVSPLAETGFILASGPDTEKLLQGQFTCDITRLADQGFLKGALCDVKGRMISSFVCLASGDGGVLLALHRGLVEVTLETLRKYAVFYKVELTDVSERFRAFGLHGGDPAAHPLPQALSAALATSLTLVTVSEDRSQASWQALCASHQPCGDDYWTYLLICHGEGVVCPETTGQFIPQMLNFQHTDAVNFRKGCYTGQEIVARMQYLGKLKRRMYHLRIASAVTLTPGDTIQAEGKADAGAVVMAARAGPPTHILAVLTEAAAAADRLVIGSYEGPVDVEELPYESQLSVTKK